MNGILELLKNAKVEWKKGEKVTVVEQKGKWDRVLTETGLLGYIKRKHLKNITKGNRVSSFDKPEYTSISMNEKVVLGWHQVTATAANKNLSKVVDNTKGMNVISPTWFKLSDNNGNYTSIASKDYVDAAHSSGLKVWPLIDNFSDKISTLKILSSSTNRKKLISNLMSDAKEYEFDGINIDFESLTQDNAPHFIEFIRELSASCRNNGLVLSVDVPTPASYNMYYERDALAEVVDYVINTGVAGALDPALNIFDLVCSTDAIEHDVDATYFGYERGQVPLYPSPFYKADS